MLSLSGSIKDTSYVWAVETIKEADNVNTVAGLIRDTGLVREHVPTKWLNSPEVWAALLERMPLTAMIRNLGKMTSVGLIAPLSEATKLVCNKLTNEVALKKARVHPFALLLAQTTYAAGRGVRGSLTWTPWANILAALEKAFYLAFENVEPSGKNFLLGIDVSGSMGWRGYEHMGSIAGTHIKAYQAAAVMAMAQIKTEPWCFPVAFTGNNDARRGAVSSITPLNMSECTSLNEVYGAMRVPIGPTDCAQPMIYARENKLPVDVFVVYTDNETWCGDVHPATALNDYRQAMGRDAKLVVCGMTATDFSIADPDDPGMLDVVGFDASCPAAISKFAKGVSDA
jgi:60 kDa SS-A/Ro ribonucleoprotein